MANASDKHTSTTEEEDELEALFVTFDHQFQDLQQKFSAMEKNLQEFRSDKAPDEDAGTDS